MSQARFVIAGIGAIAALAVGASFAVGGQQDKAAQNDAAWGHQHGKPKNVIFFLGDGMGTQEITAAR
jgi:alkaline phosphatase